MSEIGKYPLDDEDLEKVSGGVTRGQTTNCTMCNKKDPNGVMACSNCLNQGECPLN